MKKYLYIFILTLAPLAFAGCSMTKQTTTPVTIDQAMDQQEVNQISESESDAEAAQAAIDATDQALDDLDQVDFGEAPAME